MKHWLNKYRTWNSNQKARSLAKWEVTRTKGKARVVARWTFAYWLLVIPLEGYINYFQHGTILSWQSGHFWSEAIRHLITGFLMGLFGWASMESKYKKARLSCQNTAPGSTLS